MITTEAVGHQVATNIMLNITASGMTRKAIYTRSNMSRDTFDRRLNHGESFTIGELVRLSEALRIPLSSLVAPLTAEAERDAA